MTFSVIACCAQNFENDRDLMTLMWKVEANVEKPINVSCCLQPIDINDPKYFCVQDGKKRKLRVANITSKDEGFYKCKVQDKVTSAKLYVARKSPWSRL